MGLVNTNQAPYTQYYAPGTIYPVPWTIVAGAPIKTEFAYVKYYETPVHKQHNSKI